MHSYIGAVVSAIEGLDLFDVRWATIAILDTYHREGTVYTMGNGGSAAVASHFASDLVQRGRPPESPRPIRAGCLNDNTALLTAVANDTGYSHVYEGQLNGVLEQQDCLVCFSVSGESTNVLLAAQYALDLGVPVIGITGSYESTLNILSTDSVVVDGPSYEVVEDVFGVIAHLIVTELLRG